MTSFEDPIEDSPENRYNKVFLTARNTIERHNGVLKSRFRGLLKHCTINYDPIKSGKIICYCGVFHNIANYYKNESPDDNIEDDGHKNSEFDGNAMNWLQAGRNVRDDIVQLYFK